MYRPRHTSLALRLLAVLALMFTALSLPLDRSDAAETSTAPAPIAVMIDNFEAARPQSGLAAADVVYEALAEGGITRFLAIYDSPDPGLVGPVRSARHYYVYWAAEYNAPVVHVMASDEGYAALVNTGLADLDEHRGDPGFERSGDRWPPFNTYVLPAQARQILSNDGSLWPGANGGLIQDPELEILDGLPAPDIEINYLTGGHEVRWAYDPVRNRYLRDQDGLPHLDAATGQQITAANVIVQFIPAWQVEFVEGYLDMQLTGQGRAVYFENGVAAEGTWERETLGNHTVYRGPDGLPVLLQPGPTWIQIVPAGPIEGTLTYLHSGAGS
jgi:hypothetical protein